MTKMATEAPQQSPQQSPQPKPAPDGQTGPNGQTGGHDQSGSNGQSGAGGQTGPNGNGAPRATLWNRLFPSGPDFLKLLEAQIKHGQMALTAFEQWSNAPSEEGAQTVYRLETEADDLRRDLVLALSSAFSTPLDREDIDDLSERLDDVVDDVRNAVREAAALAVVPDAHVREMIGNLRDGLGELGLALRALHKDRRAALEHVAKAHHAGHLNERIYTRALSALFEQDDFRRILKLREIYSRMVELSEVLELSAEELAHSINKLS